jgi:hypothetical protein
MSRITIKQAKEDGFIVDTCCYPYVAYKGPRFQPTEHRDCYTELEESLLNQRDELVAALKSAKAAVKGREHTGFIDDVIAKVEAA